MGSRPSTDAKRGRFPFDGWGHKCRRFINTSLKSGLLIEQMNEEQKAVCGVLLGSLLSEAGYGKAK